YFYSYLTQAASSPLLNRPVQQELAPGSTFKIVSSVAGLEEGVIAPGTVIYDKVKFTHINPSPRCWKKAGHGSLRVSTAIEASCNYFFYTVGFRLGYGNEKKNTVSDKKGLARLKKYADMFGLTEKSGVELSEINPKFSKTDVVRSAIGQATHAYTPSQIARYVTTVANSGTCYDLTLLKKVVDINGKTVLKNKAKVRNKVSISSTTWDNIHQGMYLVANGPNSAERGMYSSLDVKVAGKTGTAQLNAYHANNAYFMSYAPYENPEISVTCVIPNGYSSANAAQIARDVYKYYFDKDKKKVSGKVKMPEVSTNQVD
ncbi:MAG: peptidase, partial [Lachnospiraceae bacterium]|nr:peptidase [Lachnospiraceae bacterium]